MSPVRITIHLVARLFRVPLLRLDGHITLDEEARERRALDRRRAAGRDLPVGRLLAEAEADLAAAEGRRFSGRGLPERGLPERGLSAVP